MKTVNKVVATVVGAVVLGWGINKVNSNLRRCVDPSDEKTSFCRHPDCGSISHPESSSNFDARAGS